MQNRKLETGNRKQVTLHLYSLKIAVIVMRRASPGVEAGAGIQEEHGSSLGAVSDLFT